MTAAERLQNHAFTRGFTSAQIARLAPLVTEVAFEEDEVILMNAERSQFFYLITGGSVSVELNTAGFAACVEALGRDQVFGWSALLDHQDTLFQVRAREHTTALRLEGAHLMEACSADLELGLEIFRRVLRVVAGRVRATEVRFAEMCGVRI